MFPGLLGGKGEGAEWGRFELTAHSHGGQGQSSGSDSEVVTGSGAGSGHAGAGEIPHGPS